MLEELRSQHSSLQQTFNEMRKNKFNPEPLPGRRDTIHPGWEFAKGGEPAPLIASVANQIRCYFFFLERSFVPSVIAIDIAAVGATPGTAVFGLYDEDQNLLCQWALPTGTTGAKLSGAVAAATMVAGYYWIAWSCDSITPTIFSCGAAGTNASIYADILNKSVTRIGRANNVMSGLALPDALGGVIADNTTVPPIVLISSETG